MLVQLSINNIALIDHLTVPFSRGLTVLTGETGAGKSIVVGALDFVLGGRADKDRVAEGAQSGRVEALFDVANAPRIAALLSEMGLEAEEGLLSIMREITSGGRSICRVAGVVLPLSQLKRVTELLVDLHGQHTHQSLLNPATHLGFLDAMGSDEHRRAARSLRESFAGWNAAKKALQAAEDGALERARRLDMLRFQLEELENAGLKEGEEEELESWRMIMRNAERIRENLERACANVTGSFEDDMPSAMDSLRIAMDALSSISRYGGRYEQAYDQLAEAVYTLEGLARDLDDLREAAEGDPERLNMVENRLDQLAKLKRKYGSTTHDMIVYRERVREELDETEHADIRMEALRGDEEAKRKALVIDAQALSCARHALAEECKARVEAELMELGMSSARFEVCFDTDAALSPDGLDKVEFLLSANVGEPMRPLSKVASGGELSRIMLAFKCIEAEKDGIDVMVFDEIDTGISGHTGQVVAEKMKRVARARQVLCVTHLPQIAAAGDAQYLVAKHEKDGRTHTTVTPLDREGRVEALARMLGGGETARDHAQAMLSR